MESGNRNNRFGLVFSLILVAVLSAVLVIMNVSRIMNSTDEPAPTASASNIAAESPEPVSSGAPGNEQNPAGNNTDNSGTATPGPEATVSSDNDSDNISVTVYEQSPYCIISIACDSVLDYGGRVDEALYELIPPNGIILCGSDVALSGGESVYDVLVSVCNYTGIPVDSSTSFLGVYVRGINGLYEKDFGGSSGWVYYVNGVQPNCSCDKYTVSNGDSIVWAYVCG